LNRTRAVLAALLLAPCVPCTGWLHAQSLSCEPGDREVVQLAFEGNQAFPGATLAASPPPVRVAELVAAVICEPEEVVVVRATLLPAVPS